MHLRYLAAVFILCFVIPAKAQHPFSIVHYDETRLPQTSIGSIQQDNQDYLWMNSQYGIVRFDGESFRTFTTDNLKGLSSNRIRLCAKGGDGAVYFVDENHVIVKVTAPNSFETIVTDTAIAHGRVPLYASESNSDFIWLPTDKTFSYNRFTTALNMDKQREILKVYATGANSGYFFYLDTRGLRWQFHFTGASYAVQPVSDSFRLQHTFKLNNHVFWQASPSEAFLLEEATGKRKIKVSGLSPHYADLFMQSDPVVFCNATGTFMYTSGSLYQYQFDNDEIKATLLFAGLPCSGVTNVMKEKTTGDFFISTKSEGFYQVKEKRFSVINLLQPEKNASGQNLQVNNNIIYALHFWDKQHLFADGYIKTIRDSGFVQHLFPVDYARYNLYFLYKADSNHIWVDNEGWLQSIDIKTGVATRICPVFNAKKAIPLSGSTIVVLASHKIIAVQNGTITDWYSNDTMNFTTIEKVSDSCLAVGSQNGLYYFYPAQKKLQLVPYEKELKVRYLLSDRANRIWFTTYGQGLFYLHNNRIVALPTDNQYLSISHGIVQDRTGDFWVSTNHGLFKIQYVSLLDVIEGKSSKIYYTYFDKTDGFNTNEFNGGCTPAGLYQPETGWMFFPSMDGIVRFKPDSIKNIDNSSPIYFDEAVHNDTGHVYALHNKIIFDKNTALLRIFFSSPYFGNSANMKYSYTLSTAPADWRAVENIGSITLNNLPGGSYTLRIKKEEAAGEPFIASFQFEIERKFSETIWFKLLVVLCIIGLVFLYFKARLYYLHKEHTRLEREVAARTADQVRLISDLKNTVSELKQVQQELSQMIEHRENIMGVLIHDIKSPLRFLNTVAAHLTSTLQQNKLVKNKEIAGEIASSLNKLYLFVQDFALWLGAATPGRLQQNEKADLQKLLTEIITVFNQVTTGKGISIQQSLHATAVYGDPAMIKSVLRNLLDNAVKNMDGGSITVSATRASGMPACEIVISDEGKGLSQEQVNELNRYFTTEQEALSFSTERSGHKIIKDFIQKLHGHIRYKQNSPHGLIVTVALPAEALPSNTRV